MSVHVLAGDHIVSSDTIKDLRRILPMLGEGVSRRTYDLGNGTVLKVGQADSWAGGNRTEVECWEAYEGEELSDFLAPIVAYDSEDFAWLIMVKMDGIIEDASSEIRAQWYASDAYRALSSSEIGDLHGGNVGYVEEEDGNVRFYAIDYAMNPRREGGAEVDSWGDRACCATCCHGCSVHSERGRSDACCDVAGFNTHDCRTLDGCDEEWCDAPNCGNRAVLVLCTLNELRMAKPGRDLFCADMVWTRDRAVVCGNHVPMDMHNADMQREFDGQLAMFGRYFSRRI